MRGRGLLRSIRRKMNRLRRTRRRSNRSNQLRALPPPASSTALAFDTEAHWKEINYDTVIRKVTRRANEIAQKYTVVWIQVCTYQRRGRSTYRTVHLICYRASKANHTTQRIESHNESITSTSQWMRAMQNVFDNQKTQKLLGINMDAYHSIQERVENSLINDAIGIGGDLAGGVGSGLTFLNNGQVFGGDFNFLTEPRMFSVFFCRKSCA